MTFFYQPRALLWSLAPFLLAGLMLGLLFVAAEVEDGDEEDPRPEQVIHGEALYHEHCAQCHGVGEEGESRSAPKLIGEGHPLRVYRTAQILYDYTSLTMPFDEPDALEDEEYWAVIAFMLDANDLLPEGAELSPENAGEIELRRE